MVDDEGSDWFVSGEKRPITFERRIPEIMLPCMKEAGLENMQPDLIVFSSLFWDESYIWRVSHTANDHLHSDRHTMLTVNCDLLARYASWTLQHRRHGRPARLLLRGTQVASIAYPRVYYPHQIHVRGRCPAHVPNQATPSQKQVGRCAQDFSAGSEYPSGSSRYGSAILYLG